MNSEYPQSSLKTVIHWKYRTDFYIYNYVKIFQKIVQYTHICPFSKVNSAYVKHKIWPRQPSPANPVNKASYSTNWDRNGWPGSEIQMYYGCPCPIFPNIWSILLSCINIEIKKGKTFLKNENSPFKLPGHSLICKERSLDSLDTL